jgi:hypothetical protein
LQRAGLPLVDRVCRTNAGHYGISCILIARRVCVVIAVMPMASAFMALRSVPRGPINGTEALGRD